MMIEDKIPPIAPPEPLAPGAQIAGLVQDVKMLALAELDYARARLSYSGKIAKQAGIYAVLALMMIGSACIALVLGTLLILDSYWGPWVATFGTVFLFVIIALVLALRAKAISKKLDFKGDHNV
jgi:uncharacterized membrane protein